MYNLTKKDEGKEFYATGTFLKKGNSVVVDKVGRKYIYLHRDTGSIYPTKFCKELMQTVSGHGAEATVELFETEEEYKDHLAKSARRGKFSTFVRAVNKGWGERPHLSDELIDEMYDLLVKHNHIDEEE